MIQKFTMQSGVRTYPSHPASKFSIVKLAVFVVLILVVIGGFIWLLGKFSKKGEKKQDQNTNQTEATTTTTTTQEIVEEDTSNKDTEQTTDSTAEAAPKESDFTKNNQQIGSDSVTDVKITGLTNQKYEGFYRITLSIETTGDFPLTTAVLQPTSNQITLSISGISEDKSGLTPGNRKDITESVVASIFREITSEQNTSKYIIGIKKLTGSYLHTLDSPKRIVLDVQEQAVENGDGAAFAFSQEAQTITGDASGNVITISGLSYSSQSDAFRIIFRLGSVGTGTIPSATAEIVDYAGGKAVKLEIFNLYSDFPGKNNYNQTYNDKAVSALEGSFASNKSTYYIKLKSLRDYKLYYSTAPAQLIVDVKY
jgi:hypothetical protein